MGGEGTQQHQKERYGGYCYHKKMLLLGPGL